MEKEPLFLSVYDEHIHWGVKYKETKWSNIFAKKDQLYNVTYTTSHMLSTQYLIVLKFGKKLRDIDLFELNTHK